MAKKRSQNKSTSVVVTTTAPSSSNNSQPRRKRNKKSGSRATPTWGALVRNPFSCPPVHIPDQVTTPSGLVTTISNLRVNFPAAAGTSVSHSGGYVFMPHFNCGITGITETSAGNGQLSDLNAVGTATPLYYDWANYSSALTIESKARCLAIGIRVTYEGTELNRSGRFVAGTAPISAATFGVVGTGTKGSLCSTLFHTVTPTLTQLRNGLHNVCEARVADGVFTASWTPNGVPTYQNCSTSIQDLLPTAVSASTHAFNTLYSAPTGSAGCETGQNAFVFFVEGDTTSLASGSANTYAIEIVAHWEVVPSDPPSVSYPLTPSFFNPPALAQSLNSITSSARGYVTSSASFAGSAPEGYSNFDMSSMYQYLPSSSQLMSAARMGNRLAAYYMSNQAARQQQRMIGY